MLEMLQHPFFQNALISGVLVALLCSFLGVYVVLKRIVFVGIALAQLASAGVALALLLHLHPLLLALTFSLAGVAFFSQAPSQRRVPLEGVIGASYIFAAALGILFVAKNPVGEARSLNVLFGNILSVQTGELVILAVIFALIAAIHFVFYKEFLFVSFDFETAQALGVNARFWNLLLYLTLGLAIAFAIRSMGVLLVFAFLVVPAMTARLLASRMRTTFLLALLFGGLSVPLGLYLAFHIDLPTGTTVAGTSTALLLLVLIGRFLIRTGLRLKGAAVALVLVTLPVGFLPTSTGAQDISKDGRLETMEQEIEGLKRSIKDLKETVLSQEELLRKQERQLEELRKAEAEPAPPPTPPEVVPAPVQEPPSAVQRFLGGLLLNPEMRVEGNVIGGSTWGLSRDPEAEGFASDRVNLKEVELGFRAAVDPFAIFEAIVSGQHLLEIEDGQRNVSAEVELEEAFLTLPRLPLGIQAKLGRFRTSFGEFSDSDPAEFPEIDPPNIVVHLFGDEGEGWTDNGFNVNYQVGNPWTPTITHLLWFGLYNGDNDVAFHGGTVNKPVYFSRFETFFEVGPRSGAELGISFATGRGNALEMVKVKEEDENGTAEEDMTNAFDQVLLRNDAARVNLLNAHFEFDWRHPVLTLYRGFNVLIELFYSNTSVDGGTHLEGEGGYALAEYLFTRRWSVGTRVDYVHSCPGFPNSLCTRIESDKDIEDRREWAASGILTFKPSRFLNFRLQYKHTDRNYAEDSDEILAQALFIIGFERPGPF